GGVAQSGSVPAIDKVAHLWGGTSPVKTRPIAGAIRGAAGAEPSQERPGVGPEPQPQYRCPAAPFQARWIASKTASILIRADDLAVVPSAQGPPGLDRDRALDEMHAAVGEHHVGPAGVLAVGIGDLAVVRQVTRAAPAAPVATTPAEAPWVLLRVGRDDGVE